MSRLICLIAFEKTTNSADAANMMCLVHQVAVIVKQNKGLGMPVIRVFAIAIPKMAAVYLS